MSDQKRCGTCNHWSGHGTQRCQHPDVLQADTVAYETDYCDGWEPSDVFSGNLDEPEPKTEEPWSLGDCMAKVQKSERMAKRLKPRRKK